ncbi:dynein heavy chain, partial [Cystoisospora suis]
DEEEQFRLFVDLGFAPRALGKACSVAFLKRPGFSLDDQPSGTGTTTDGDTGRGASASSSSSATTGTGGGDATGENGGGGEGSSSSHRRKTIGQQLAVMRCGFGDESETSLDVTQLYMQRGLAPLLNVALTQKDAQENSQGAGSQGGPLGSTGTLGGGGGTGSG